jgi:hypothetical protein
MLRSDICSSNYFILNFLGCGCRAFNSDFLCAACDQHWEKHETFFETEKERKEKKLPYGKRSYFYCKFICYTKNNNNIIN